MQKRSPYCIAVAKKIVELIRMGHAPWQRPWEPYMPSSLPFNITTKQRYRGINSINLMSRSFRDPRWMTARQAARNGFSIKKGQERRGSAIQRWVFDREENELDENGDPVIDENGRAVKCHVQLERPLLLFSTVYNAEQILGVRPIAFEKRDWDPVERAEKILVRSGAKVLHDQDDRAFYSIRRDSIHLPQRYQFSSAAKYYAVALHELGHWTGHPTRLNRDLAHPFGSEKYAIEELCAEIASMMLGDTLSLGHDPSQHAAYVGSWIKAVQEDPLVIFKAAATAEKIQSYIMQFDTAEVSAIERSDQPSQPHQMRPTHPVVTR